MAHARRGRARASRALGWRGWLGWRLWVLAAALLAGGAATAHAALVLTGTRLIYHAGAHEARIGVLNAGTEPELMQAWIDAGDAEARPQDIRVPFVLTPPMARIDPGQRQTLGVMFTGPALPADRESLFWLNVLDIPPKQASAAGHNYIQFAVRTRIKLIYRPASLQGDPAQAMRSLRWSEHCGQGGCVLRARNPTPYCMPIVALRGLDGTQAVVGPWQGTVLPFETRDWKLGEGVHPGSVQYVVINDFGAFVHAASPVAK